MTMFADLLRSEPRAGRAHVGTGGAAAQSPTGDLQEARGWRAVAGLDDVRPGRRGVRLAAVVPLTVLQGSNEVARVALVAFDLDGTLVRGETCVQAIARAIDRADDSAAFERLSMRDVARVTAAREEMASWYAGRPLDTLLAPLAELQLADGSEEAFRLLREAGVATAIVSITWDMAVKWFAARLGADYWAGTSHRDDGTIDHFWPEDKPRWLRERASEMGATLSRVAAVGDSDGDLEMLAAVGRPVFVGLRAPQLPNLVHVPSGNLLEVAETVLADDWPPAGHSPGR